ncbi:circularly permuted type 2 ATP-grasp protein [Pyruvatibacter sp.]|uniref:circularly permuted type 2 ATP-grasp protein n=1 Tax=Pyruvatibacter sp. TaxID=1981328 RepID=UPI0032ECDE17
MTKTGQKKKPSASPRPRSGAVAAPDVPSLMADYDAGDFYCELTGAVDEPARFATPVRKLLDPLDMRELRRRAREAERELFNSGITFTVYTKKNVIDRVLPFDIIPRVISKGDWAKVETGVQQRVKTINKFLHDIYHEQRCIKDGVVPASLVEGNENFRDVMKGVDLPYGTYAHICGVDLVRDGQGDFRVLEDNARTPSGVSYVIENRHLMQRAFPDLMRNIGLRHVSNYGQMLHEKLAEVAPANVRDPQVVVLTPGVYNSAFFEHVFLSREMGVPLVEGRDLVVRDDKVFMQTIKGLEPVHVIYRRIDDDFLDPETFNPESALGVPGIMRSYLKGNVALANAVGTGVADDKAVYAYMPRLIEYYLGEKPALDNVDTYICSEPEGLEYTLDNLENLVVKPVGGSGGYGVVIGPRASKREIARTRKLIKDDPDNFISQPMINLSVSPTLMPRGVEPRHVDLRPFAVTGKNTWVLPGGLTRVALKKGSLVVNSSQGGGSKDTWVLE